MWRDCGHTAPHTVTRGFSPGNAIFLPSKRGQVDHRAAWAQACRVVLLGSSLSKLLNDVGRGAMDPIIGASGVAQMGGRCLWAVGFIIFDSACRLKTVRRQGVRSDNNSSECEECHRNGVAEKACKGGHGGR